MADLAPGAPAPAAEAPIAAPAAPDLGSTADLGSDDLEGHQPEPAPEKTLTQSEVNKLIAREKAKESRRVERAVRAEVERDILRRQLEERDRPAPKPQDTQSGKPKPDDFRDWESYNEALTDWKVEQRLAKEREQSQASGRERAQEMARAQQARAIQENFKAAAEKHADFHEVVTQEGLPFYEGSPILAYITKSKAGGDIAYFLGNNRDEADRIADLHPIDQVLALNALESKLAAPPKPTQTPPPIVPNSGQARVTKDWNDMSTQEHIKAYHARKKR